MRTCKVCGCYIPDLWSECPACGRVLHDGGNLGSIGTTPFEIVDAMWERERWRDAFSCPPSTVLRRKGFELEDLDMLQDAPVPAALTRAIVYNGLGGNAAGEKTGQESSCFTSTTGVWSRDPNVKPYPIEIESYWPWSEIKLHQGTNK